MHAELVVPGLLPDVDAQTSALQFPPTPALELLLARGRRTSAPRADYEQWLAAASGRSDAGELPAGALTLLAEGGTPGDAV